MEYRAYLDGLRAIAVLSVVLFHAKVPGFGGGFVGVDVFFVISGYLISGLLVREAESSGDISIAAFAERRVRRLAPSLFVVLLSTIVAGFVILTPIGGEQQGLAKSALSAVFLSANTYFLFNTGGYFDDPTENMPLLHFWTLAVEEQFYLVWPWVVLVFFRARRARKLKDFCLWLAVLGFVGCALTTSVRPAWAFYLTPFRVWEFAVGALLSVRRVALARGPSSELAAVCGLLLIGLSVVLVDAGPHFPGWVAGLPVLGTALVIVGVEGHPLAVTARILAVRPLVRIGLISYSLYLWHWPILTYWRLATLGGVDLAGRLCLCALSVGLAELSYRFVELPIRSKRVGLMASARRTAFSGGALAAVAVLISLCLGAWAKLVWPTLPGNGERAARSLAAQKPEWDCPPASRLRQLKGASACRYGEGRVRTVIWGDSHAGQLLASTRAWTGIEKEAVALFHRPSCPPALGYRVSGTDADIRECAAFNRDVLAEIRALSSERVILTARWNGYMEHDVDGLRAGLRDTLRSLEGLDVTLVGAGVEFEYRVPDCLLRRSDHECGVSLAKAQEVSARARDALRSVLAEFPRVRIVDPMEVLCKEMTCPVFDGEEVLYWDRHHLSIAGANRLTWAVLGHGRRAPP